MVVHTKESESSFSMVGSNNSKGNKIIGEGPKCLNRCGEAITRSKRVALANKKICFDAAKEER
jgi:formylmethanofuran dehydrogenase subunit E